MNARVKATDSQDQTEETIASNIETLILLDEDAWSILTVQERLDVLQTVANIERYYLGLPNELNVGVANLGKNGETIILASYTDVRHEIIISLSHLLYDSPWDVLDSVCHEAYHSYQCRLVEALNEMSEENQNLKMFSRIRSYAEEIDCYKDGEDSFIDYYSQKCESDARDYAENAVEDYYR